MQAWNPARARDGGRVAYPYTNDSIVSILVTIRARPAWNLDFILDSPQKHFIFILNSCIRGCVDNDDGGVQRVSMTCCVHMALRHCGGRPGAALERRGFVALISSGLQCRDLDDAENITRTGRGST